MQIEITTVKEKLDELPISVRHAIRKYSTKYLISMWLYGYFECEIDGVKYRVTSRE